MSVDLELAPKQKRPAGEPCCEPVVYPDVERDHAQRMAEVAKALGEPIRLQLVDVLRKHAGKVCVCELVPLFEISQPTLSHHLKKLRQAGAAAAIADSTGSGCCGAPAAIEGCGPDIASTDKHGNEVFGVTLYDGEGETAPKAAVEASLGCGVPTAVADLREGETVLDLGSGGGIDVLLSARRVGEHGLAYGLDMTDEMLALAQRNAAAAGVRNAIFLKGVIEEIPLPAESVDVVISNCVINLSTDKPAVLTEIARVLKPSGRIGISDVVAEDRLTEPERAERGSYVGCIAGALSKSEYEAGLQAAGFREVSVEFTHPVADGMHGAIVKGVKSR